MHIAKTTLVFVILVLLLGVLSAASIFIGAADFSSLILLQSRLPRLITVLLSGAGMAVCGLIMQRISRNPFASPETAGTLDAAALGYVLALLILPAAPVYVRMIFSFAVAMAGSTAFFSLLPRIQKEDILYVPLTGLVLGGIFSAATQILAYRFDLLQVLNTWLFADYSLIITGRFEILYAIIPAVGLAYLYAHHITIAGMGKDFAKNLGAHYQRTVVFSMLLVALVSALVVVTAGRVPFLGLIVPNLVTRLFSDDVRRILPLTAASGALLLLASDVFGRLILMPFEMPVGLTMGIVGSLTFLIIMRMGRQRG